MQARDRNRGFGRVPPDPDLDATILDGNSARVALRPWEASRKVLESGIVSQVADTPRMLPDERDGTLVLDSSFAPLGRVPTPSPAPAAPLLEREESTQLLPFAPSRALAPVPGPAPYAAPLQRFEPRPNAPYAAQLAYAPTVPFEKPPGAFPMALPAQPVSSGIHYVVPRATPPLTGFRVERARGLPAGFALFLGLVAVAAALACDFVFLQVRVPAVGGYAWYLTTALSFFTAGYGTASLTRAGRGMAATSVMLAAALYGAADVALALLVESLSLHGAVILAAQGVAIALLTGWGGARRGFRARP